MRLRNICLAALMVLAVSCGEEKEKLVLIHTPYGDMKVLLYEETPLHKENFLNLVQEGKYDSTTFHRVIENFMIQAGDITAKEGITPEEKRAETNRTIPAEFVDKFVHVKGALAAARQGDNVNPEKRSSGSQFYIVQGDELADIEKQRNDGMRISMLQQILSMPKYASLRDSLFTLQREGETAVVERFFNNGDTLIEKEMGGYEKFVMADSVKERYGSTPGAPHLDGTYTVFGKVVEGLPVIDSVAQVQTGPYDKPEEPIYITMEIVEESRKEVTEKYGYTYPEEKE
ncbi:peptidylprolyl isomerase [Roseivirga sp. BDSF3-8]|uniref:peptidylprolyl isomerase n=1 Tax=Roseivirga sp. BDSF3-8 TaxID=3241598 RepID=UPI0035326FDE